jgi:hypothetical protein
MPDFKIKTPAQIKCPFKCNAGWIGEPEITLDGKVWTASSQCSKCGAYAVWDFSPDKPLSVQQLWVKESYEGFWEGGQ